MKLKVSLILIAIPLGNKNRAPLKWRYTTYAYTPQSNDWSYQLNDCHVLRTELQVRRSSRSINAIENDCNVSREHTMDVVFMEVLMRSASRYVVFCSGMWADKQRDDCRSVGTLTLFMWR